MEVNNMLHKILTFFFKLGHKGLGICSYEMEDWPL